MLRGKMVLAILLSLHLALGIKIRLNATVTGAPYMDCGSAPLCGVMVLESGYGTSKYHHNEPCVHGIWPETGNYGSSSCIKPQSSQDPSTTASCYDDISFMTHEWEKHGTCAGVADADNFFSQVCSLSSAPLSVMSPLKEAGKTLQDMASALKADGYPVYYVDNGPDSQVYLSVCSSGNGQWQVADVSEFSNVCAGSGPAPKPSPGGKCIPNQHGPSCSKDEDCSGYDKCVRCASSGFCTCTGKFSGQCSEHN